MTRSSLRAPCEWKCHIALGGAVTVSRKYHPPPRWPPVEPGPLLPSSHGLKVWGPFLAVCGGHKHKQRLTP